MGKYKAGDKVRCIENTGIHRKGEILTVSKEHGDHWERNPRTVYTECACTSTHDMDSFELVTSATPVERRAKHHKCENCGQMVDVVIGHHLPGGAFVKDCEDCHKKHLTGHGRKDYPKCPRCGKVLEDCGCDGLQPVRMTPEVRCACCHAKAPRVVVKDHPREGNLLYERDQKVNQPDLNGWLIMVFPYNDSAYQQKEPGAYHHRFGAPWQEVMKVCPKCAPQVMGTVKHMASGWRK